MMRETLSLINEIVGEIFITVCEKVSSSERSEQDSSMATTNNLKTPEFISDTKTFKIYEKDVKMWSRMTSLKAELQAEWIVLNLDGHPSGIKETIQTHLGDKLENNANGIKDLLTFLKGIYDIDDFQDCYDTYMEFEELKKIPDESMIKFLNRWDLAVAKIKKHECDIPDLVLALKLLKAARLDNTEHQLVISGINDTTGKTEKNLEKQTKESLKKFIGKPIVKTEEKSENTYITKEELTFLLKNHNPKKRENPADKKGGDPKKQKGNQNYKGRKNALGADNLPP